MDFTVQMTYRRVFTDSRLSFRNESGLDYITLRDPNVIWIPDSFFPNGVTMETHNQLARIYPNGEVYLSERVTVTLTCPMNLVNYPFDVQACPIKIASCKSQRRTICARWRKAFLKLNGSSSFPTDGYPTNKQVILWKTENPVQVAVMLNLPGFRLTDYHTDYASQRTNTGEYSAIRLSLVFEREFTYYLVTVFVPITMLVIVSWLSFFIGIGEQFLKSIIPLLSLITLTLALNIWNKDQPQVSYTKAFDVWLGTCVTFIFAALIESVVVYLKNRSACDRKAEVDLNDSVDKNVSRHSAIVFCFLN